MHFYVILPYKVKRMCKIRRRDTVKCPGFNWFTTGPIPVDAKGATMAKLDKLANENRIENRNRKHNNILFGSRPRIQCFAIYYERTLCSLLLSIHTDGIRTFLNTLTKEIEANCKITYFCSGIINLLFVDK